ncbi:MAG: hypothetical protein KBD47_02095 [Candidatus Pacebacteria bacterium]|jgi:hypothetical protein|nr:hypothetical protein [Candidatus Paceibacterota bacterium]
MKTTLVLLFLVATFAIAFWSYTFYHDWKYKQDMNRARLAAYRLRLSNSMAMGYVTIDILGEIKILLRFCRAYRLPLSYFSFWSEDALIDQAIRATARQAGSLKCEWPQIRAELARYTLKHV